MTLGEALRRGAFMASHDELADDDDIREVTSLIDAIGNLLNARRISTFDELRKALEKGTK
jgi:hypothetical protein